MAHLTLDTALNLVWLGIGVFALAALAALEWKRLRSSSLKARLLRFCAVALVTVALFPCVSCSDDLFHFSFLPLPGGHRGAGTPAPEEEQSSLHLLRLLQSLDHWQVSAVYSVALAFWFCAFVFVRRARVLCCFVRPRSGRAPPLAR